MRLYTSNHSQYGNSTLKLTRYIVKPIGFNRRLLLKQPVRKKLGSPYRASLMRAKYPFAMNIIIKPQSYWSLWPPNCQVMQGLLSRKQIASSQVNGSTGLRVLVFNAVAGKGSFFLLWKYFFVPLLSDLARHKLVVISLVFRMYPV